MTPISKSEVGSVQASSLFLVSRLNCSITTSDGTVLSSNTKQLRPDGCWAAPGVGGRVRRRR